MFHFKIYSLSWSTLNQTTYLHIYNRGKLIQKTDNTGDGRVNSNEVGDKEATQRFVNSRKLQVPPRLERQKEEELMLLGFRTRLPQQKLEARLA